MKEISTGVLRATFSVGEDDAAWAVVNTTANVNVNANVNANGMTCAIANAE